MVNNVSVTQGTGTTFKTTDTAGVHTGHVNVDSSALPTGAASAAKQDTLQTATDAIKTAVELLDNTVAGTELQVDVVAALPAGTNIIGKIKIVNDAGTVVDPVEQVAHDAADSGDPVKIGFKAIAALSGATLVAAADRTNSHADLDGAQLVRDDAALGDLVDDTASTTASTSTACLAAGAAGIKHHITDIELANSSATNVTVNILDGATVRWTMSVPANGGNSKTFRKPLKGTAATAWNFQSSSAVSTVHCSMIGFKSKV